jgi:uncharacterized protein (DUF4213/DUF364 family)
MSPGVSAGGPLSQLFDDLLQEFPQEASLINAVVGLHWTLVTLDLDGQVQSGLASSVTGDHAHGEQSDVNSAGDLLDFNAQELAAMVHSQSPTERALGMAAINASLSQPQAGWQELDAVELLISQGRGKRVGLVGHFPFIPQLKPAVGQLHVLEQEPAEGELSAEAAAEILPQCQVIGVTSMTLLNGTFNQLAPLLSHADFVMLLGPSTPLSTHLLEIGVDALAGTVVENTEAISLAVAQGANYRQLHKIGTRLVTLTRRGKG